MELLQLRYFCDAAKNENFSSTAKKFGVPTSAVSQSIHRLENELGVSFFSRHANSIKLSEDGKEFYSKISSSLALLDDAVASVSNGKQKRSLSICIYARRRRILEIIGIFKKKHPNIDVIVKHGTDITKNDCDIIVADPYFHLPEFNKHLVASEGFTIAINKNNPLASCKNLTVDMLKNEPFVAYNDQRPMHKIVVNLCSDFGFKPHITLLTDDPSYIGRLVSLGMGVAIVPESHSPEPFSDDVIFYPIKGYTRDIYAYVLQSKELLPHVNDFLNLLKEI